MELTTCPECGVPAEVTWRYCEESTGGPVEHVRLQCLRRHWFLGPSGTLLPQRRPGLIDPAAAPLSRGPA